MDTDRLRNAILSRAFLTVACSTILLTWAFVGVAVLMEGLLVPDVPSRVPLYGLVFAIAFVLSLWKLDDRSRDGTTILIATTGIGAGVATVVGLASEGALYTVENPSTVLTRPELFVGFTTAALICTGLGIWGVRHWREYVAPAPPAPETDADREMEPLE